MKYIKLFEESSLNDFIRMIDLRPYQYFVDKMTEFNDNGIQTEVKVSFRLNGVHANIVINSQSGEGHSIGESWNDNVSNIVNKRMAKIERLIIDVWVGSIDSVDVSRFGSVVKQGVNKFENIELHTLKTNRCVLYQHLKK